MDELDFKTVICNCLLHNYIFYDTKCVFWQQQNLTPPFLESLICSGYREYLTDCPWPICLYSVHLFFWALNPTRASIGDKIRPFCKKLIENVVSWMLNSLPRLWRILVTRQALRRQVRWTKLNKQEGHVDLFGPSLIHPKKALSLDLGHRPSRRQLIYDKQTPPLSYLCPFNF